MNAAVDATVVAAKGKKDDGAYSAQALVSQHPVSHFAAVFQNAPSNDLFGPRIPKPLSDTVLLLSLSRFPW